PPATGSMRTIAARVTFAGASGRHRTYLIWAARGGATTFVTLPGLGGPREVDITTPAGAALTLKILDGGPDKLIKTLGTVLPSIRTFTTEAAPGIVSAKRGSRRKRSGRDTTR